MRTDDFWQLIDQARAGAGGEADAVAARAVALLAERDPEDIVGYAHHQQRVLAASYRVDLWGAAYLINGGASDDGFEYFRGWLMTQGRAVFAARGRRPGLAGRGAAGPVGRAQRRGVRVRGHAGGAVGRVPEGDRRRPAGGA